MNFYKLGIIVLAVFFSENLHAQSIVSPYSNNGLGEILFQGLPHNYSMGGVGIGTPSPWHINLQNSAQLINNNLSSFQVGLIADFRNYQSSVGSNTDQAASLRFLALSFPVVKNRWTSSVALLPFSSVQYNTFSEDSLDEVSAITQFQGEGGLTQLIWAHGIRVYKTLSIGVKTSYIFGSIDRESRIQLLGDEFGSNYAISYLESTSYSDFNLSLGLAYKLRLSDTRFFNFGFTQSLSNELEGSEDRFYERLRLTGSTIQSQVIDENVKSTFTLPASYGIGFSYELLNQLRLGMDIEHQRWNGANEGRNDLNLRNILNLSLGTEWTPDYKSVNSYIKRSTYRLGFGIKQLPYLVNNTKINDFGINFGASFPVSGYSSLDAAFKLGFRGTENNNLIREQYFQIVIGATINDRWFIKRRYD